jgi:hypothetical protein
MNLAPIAIGTYTRLAHLKLTVQALKENTLAHLSRLYILSDAPQAGDEEKVQQLREFANGITGFKQVTVFKRTINGRVANNRGGMHQLMKKYGKVIFLEDDIVTAPGFLQFMNDALVAYEDNPEVLSICGYTPPLDYSQKTLTDAIALPRLIGWGLGLWLDKFEKITPITLDDYQKITATAESRQNVNTQFGKDFINRYKAEAYGHIDGLDNRGSFLQMRTGMFSIHPKQSLVANIGNDGSGLHASKNNKFDVELCRKTANFKLDSTPSVNDHIRQQSIAFFAPNEDDMLPEIVDNIIAQIEAQKIYDITLWGTDVLTTLFLAKLPSHIKVNGIVDSWAQENDKFQEYKVTTPARAYSNGLRVYVIMSFASRFKIAEAAHALGDNCVVIKYEE